MNYRPAIAAYLAKEKATIDLLDQEELQKAIETMAEARGRHRMVFTMGNGGSASTASHMAGDFNKGLSYGKEKRFRFLCLSDNQAGMLALANDVSYDDVFVEQLKNFAEPGDVVVAISGSGNSENVLRAVRYAKAVGCTIIAMTGYDGGKLMPLADIRLHAPVDDMQITEDIHMIFNHLMMSVLYHQ